MEHSLLPSSCKTGVITGFESGYGTGTPLSEERTAKLIAELEVKEKALASCMVLLATTTSVQYNAIAALEARGWTRQGPFYRFDNTKYKRENLLQSHLILWYKAVNP